MLITGREKNKTGEMMSYSKIKPFVRDYSNSILCRRWKEVCISAWIVFILFEICLINDSVNSKNPICPYSSADFGYFYWYSVSFSLGGFIFTWIILLTRIFYTKSGPERVYYFTAFNILSMCCITCIAGISSKLGRICIDPFGVATLASVWPGWVVNGPLLIVLTLSLTDKPTFSAIDWLIIFSIFSCLSCFFLVLVAENDGVSTFWILLAVILYLPSLLLPWQVRRQDVEELPIEKSSEHFFLWGFGDPLFKRFNAAVVLTVGFGTFPVTYLLAHFGAINAEVTIALFEILSVLTKGLYTAVLMEMHLEHLKGMQRVLVEEQRMNDTRRAFLKYIFHEVRTPLNSLSMGIEILERSHNLDYSDRESLLMMKGASNFMSDTLEDVLSMQKIEEGKLKLDFSPFLVEEAVTKVLSSFYSAAVIKNLTLLKDIPENVPKCVMGDKIRVEQVMGNLLSNAIKFSPENKTILLSITAEPIADASGPDSISFLTFSVTDEGPGIVTEKQKHIFGNFNHIRPTQLQLGQGSGIGLPLCKEIVSLHGGTIGLTSPGLQTGVGCVFHFTIPFLIVRDHVLLDSTALLKETRKTSTFRPRVRSNNNCSEPIMSLNVAIDTKAVDILVVDDVTSNRKMLQMLLRKIDIESDMAENGETAVNKVLEDISKYRIIFMDNLMPIMNGVEATRLLRQRGFRNLIVGVTGNVMDDDIFEYLLAGADMVVAKPMKMPTLSSVLRYAEENGPASYFGEGMTLVTGDKGLHWAPLSPLGKV